MEAYKAQVGIYPGAALPVTGWQLNAANSVAAGYPNTLDPTALEALLGTATDPGGNTVGPWLKDTPYNPGDYRIAVLNDGSGKVQVTDGAGQPLADCSLVS